jgi:hypothetical protein
MRKPDSDTANRWFPLDARARRNDPAWVSLNGCGRSSKAGGRVGCTAARTGTRKIPVLSPPPVNSGSVPEVPPYSDMSLSKVIDPPLSLMDWEWWGGEWLG